MAFKMKGFPFAGKSPIKDITRNPSYPGSHNEAHQLFDEGKGPDPHAETKPLKQKEEKSFTDNEESYMDKVYAEVSKMMGDSGGYDIGEIVAMSEKERIGNIDGYESGDFAKMVAKAKKKVKR
tara:strand:+ start:40 stop:408 length:369 start_codon:yes stop_codon:yes gene_type:complete